MPFHGPQSYAARVVGKVCGPLWSNWGAPLGESKSGVKVRILNTNVVRVLSHCARTVQHLSDGFGDSSGEDACKPLWRVFPNALG